MSVVFHSVDPRTGEQGRAFTEATAGDVQRAVAAAVSAFASAELADAARRAAGLRRTAVRLRARGPEIVATARSETGLPDARLSGELERTCVQLELLADVAEHGEDLDVIIDPADVNARPVPRPDLRRMLVPVGPVVVFGASNFPFAFSTAGGDTASALAAGCPVLVKGHPCHPATGEIVAQEVTAALEEARLPDGTFAHLLSAGHEVGLALVDHPDVRAVAFTGSVRGGRALMDRAAARPVPIPVFAEMGSLNPVVITERALQARVDDVIAGLTGSICTFAGQLCTKPGLIFIPATNSGESFAKALGEAFGAREPEVMLSRGIRDAFETGIAEAAAEGATVEGGGGPADTAGFRARPVVLSAHASAIGGDGARALTEEHFGPGVVLARYDGVADVVAALARLGGQLTGTLHAEPGEPDAAPIWTALARISGRVLFGGFPTGVSVTWAMQHGGPYPSSSDGRYTSVGQTATRRFLRPVAFQSAPPELLPPALRDDNPQQLRRRVDGVLQ